MVFSYPFLSAIKAGILFKSMTMMSSRLGEVFLLEAMVPLRAQQAPSVLTGVPGAFQAIKAPEIMQEMSHIMSMLAQVLKVEEEEENWWGPIAKISRMDGE